MPSLRLVLLLLCVLPLQGLAQVSMPGKDAPTYPTPPPLVPASAEPGQATDMSGEEPSEELARGEIIPREPRADKWWGGRMTLEFLGGSLLGFAGGVPGSAMALGAAFCECSGKDDQFLAGVGLAALGLTTGAALGVMGAGSLVGGEGRFLPALVGSGLGMLGGLLGAVAVGAIAGPAAVLPLIVGPVIGAMIGFERSHSTVLATGPELAASTPQVMPLVTVTPRGGILGGLVGRF